MSNTPKAEGRITADLYRGLGVIREISDADGFSNQVISDAKELARRSSVSSLEAAAQVADIAAEFAGTDAGHAMAVKIAGDIRKLLAGVA